MALKLSVVALLLVSVGGNVPGCWEFRTSLEDGWIVV